MKSGRMAQPDMLDVAKPHGLDCCNIRGELRGHKGKQASAASPAATLPQIYRDPHDLAYLCRARQTGVVGERD